MASIVFTGRNEVLAKVMFLLVSLILFTGGGSASVYAGNEAVHAGKEAPPPGRKQCMLGRKHPPGKEAVRAGNETSPPAIRSMSGRYASYWNAFLYKEVFALQLELCRYLYPSFGIILFPFPFKLCLNKPSPNEAILYRLDSWFLFVVKELGTFAYL